MSRFVFPGVYILNKPAGLMGNPPSAAAIQQPAPAVAPAPPPVFVDPTVGLDLYGFNSFGPMNGITAITFNTTSSIPGFDIETDPELVSISFPNLVSIDPTNVQGGYLQVSGNTSLTTLSLPVFVPNNGATYALNGNALNAASVNGFLRRCVLNAAFLTGSIDLSGGTNAAPSGQGATDKLTLTGRGVTVVTN